MNSELTVSLTNAVAISNTSRKHKSRTLIRTSEMPSDTLGKRGKPSFWFRDGKRISFCLRFKYIFNLKDPYAFYL